MMDDETFLARVIDDGIAAARADYVAPDQARLLAGSLAGFEACRSLTPIELLELFNRATARGVDRPIDAHWYWRGYLNEVEWTMNVLSAVLINEGNRRC